ncbi:DUF4153 domain-containing protein [Sphingomonas edaphi]|uniref:DUF4153 domain-containing protein n=1 Tax=Sphingomonas edaphi TaxID=2315689 RepID=A0A418Q0Q1_9SPHN|nr:DUF4153 domain-containing protein [Sphingomonas edaphi]RIX31528.1 DUF4153 domain-containing protein [Sphingomonas edaphi]
MAERFDSEDRAWPSRPWIMAAIGAVGGLVIHLLTDGHTGYNQTFPVWKQAATAFTVVATIAFLLTVELRRWTWSAGFALCWGVVIALVGWFTSQYNLQGEIMEFPFLSGILAVLVAAPLFQTIRDEAAWRFPYARLHRHAWTDAVIGAASLAFTGVTFLLAWLIASLFDVIGIDALKDLLKEEWFGWTLAGFAFGAAVGLLRERDALVATLQKLVMVVFSVLAPVLAVALAAFLLSLPFKGLSGLWDSDIPATPLLLLSGAGAILLANAVIGDGREERSSNRWLQYTALALVLTVLPLAILAMVSMGQRIGQYGWTPERMWGVVAVGIAVAYGLAAWWAAGKGRLGYDDKLRPLQTKLAIGLCGLAFFLALPIVDFGAISARSQLARLNSGQVKAEEFDWTAMAFDFGPEGRERLKEIARAGEAKQRQLAGTALKTKNRWDLSRETEIVERQADIEKKVRLLSPDIRWSDELKRRVSALGDCSERQQCALIRLAPDKLVLLRTYADERYLSASIIDLAVSLPSSAGAVKTPDVVEIVATDTPAMKDVDLGKAKIEIRDVAIRQVYVDERPVGQGVRISR